ncbi:murein biosynthesis integral membrane protein MurJ [Pseudomonas plecoglossicida]|uniref:murein biosynthesis integral membrane protein MurJ n=1 Tax=Pseudomonas plecoglossicida TaxID=70775 RepID=UPI003D1E0DBA
MKVKYYGYAVLVFGLVFFGKISGLLKDLLFTYYYGVSHVTDGYFLANSISSLLYIAVYSAVPVVVVPMYSHLVSLGEQSMVDRKLTSALVFFFLISLLLGVGVASTATHLVNFFSGDADEVVRTLASDYLVIMAVTFALSTLVAFLNALQTVNKRSLPSYIVPLVNNLIFCSGLVFFGAEGGLTKVLYLGVVAWFVLLVINGYSARQFFSFNWSIFEKTKFDVKIYVLFVPAVLSFYVEQINGFVGVYFASHLEAGAISVLGYAGKLNLIFQSIFLVFLTTSLFPKIAALVTSGSAEALDSYLNRCLRLIVLCALPVIIFMVYYSTEIVDLLFKRGKFSENDVIRVAGILSVMLLAVPFVLLRDVMNRLFFSSGKNSLPVFLSLQSLAVNGTVSMLVYRNFELTGLAWATVVATLSSFIVSVIIAKRTMGISLLRSNLRTLLLALVSAAAATGLLLWLNGVLAKFWLFNFIPFVCFYAVLLYLFRVEECTLVISLIKRNGLFR